MKKTQQINLRPISTVCRRYAKASSQLGMFSMSEGYELVRTCFPNQATVRFHTANHGSSFASEPRIESIEAGREAMKKMVADFEALGYKVEQVRDLEITVEVAQ